MRKVLVVGCGFVGEVAADLLFHSGWDVIGVTASSASTARLAKKPYPVEACDITNLEQLDRLLNNAGAVESWIHCASSGRRGVEGYRAVYFEGVKNLIAATPPSAGAVFVSSTSVYGQIDGSWVDESSPAGAPAATARILLEAESEALDAGCYVARLAGIYGPGRAILVRKFLSGEAVLEEGGSRWLNQIHRDDAASAIVHLLQDRPKPGIYNVCDDAPATQLDVYSWLARYFETPLPPSGPRDECRKRGWTSKRVSNARLRATGWTPAYPSFHDAIPAIDRAGC